MFKFGKILREKYDSFLGDYRFNRVYAYSTDMDRTKVSLQAVLGGLYPPSKTNFCSEDDIKWPLIPIHTEKQEHSFLKSYFFCPK